MTSERSSSPNPKRVAAGRRNRRLRGPLTPEGRMRLRQAALANRPWRRSTGPKTAAGKARSADNGRYAQTAEKSIREVRAEIADCLGGLDQLASCRDLVREELSNLTSILGRMS